MSPRQFAPLAIVGLLLPAPAGAAAPIFGRWRTDDGSAIVRVEPCGGKLCGRIDRVLDPKAPTNDINSPDPAHRTKPLVGTTVLSGIAADQAVLHGLLQRIRDLGLPLISVLRIDPNSQS